MSEITDVYKQRYPINEYDFTGDQHESQNRMSDESHECSDVGYSYSDDGMQCVDGLGNRYYWDSDTKNWIYYS